jgi:hypothetical protein
MDDKMSFEYASERGGWPLPSEPVYGRFGAIRCKDAAHPDREWVYFPMDTPKQASETMVLMRENSRFTDLSFELNKSQLFSQGV